MKILVLRTGALGDTILLSPVLQNLRDAFPRAEIHLLGHPERVRLLLGPPNADRVFSSEDPRWLDLHRETKPKPETEKWIAGYRLVVCYSSRPGGRVERNLGEILGDRFVWGAAVPTADCTRHYVGFSLEPLRKAGLPASIRTPAVSASGKRIEEPAPDHPLIVIHPGAGGMRKRRPLEFFLQTAEILESTTDAECRFILGPAETDLEEGVRADGRTVRSGMTLEELTGLLRAARGYIGQDSGVSHLAAALGIPTVAIFTTTDPAVWRPLGENVLVLDIRHGLTDQATMKQACDYLKNRVE
jgi:ADP-heptose:LPS heptosyltransferase